MRRTLMVVSSWLCLVLGTSPAAAEVSPKTLDSISTPDKVESRLGTLDFKDGVPSKDTVAKVYDNLDFTRAFDAFVNTTVYFGPQQPTGVKRGNWIQTTPGKGWFTILRLYSPLEPFFTKVWRPSEIQLVK